ncbi:hypothetical protein TBLA_0A04730 [Henningerozyma blattae CBS 6284]|uniref:NADH:flavin oxidoreductase/NADH oxidase N-terminal domain-containing protein n=1 Tax=Henningerozyma blattae (strain ATCC 34711 / CBS 6284 / DSM 70876 / NBRC 10599 / NRRL Y-10934 / UCD 77-7) TaxID=1071380 RepID=I2GVW4_HENB6|nr:hypothetical protein TBLA_0A04730 [Tetrapisispora blattae CBS 6284]CCH58266.1 hypothetical protein TBLA_0A04730 [Tetrapisispora blattae CBS 6284]
MKRDGLRYDAPSFDLFIDEDTRVKLAKLGIERHTLTADDIRQYINDYVQAAKNSIECGADGIEIHAANSYLLNQFIDPNSNNRTDKYGGTIENRSRFILEVVDAIVAAIGAEKVDIRFSPFHSFGGMSPEDDPLIISQYTCLIGQLEKRAQDVKRLAYIHIYEPRDNIDVGELSEEVETFPIDFVYSVWKGIIIRTSNLPLLPNVTKTVLKANRTLLGYRRYFLSNPDLVDRLENGLPLNNYDRATMFTQTKAGYIDYPTYDEALKMNW